MLFKKILRTNIVYQPRYYCVVQAQASFEEYKIGLNYFNQGKTRLALEFFNRFDNYLTQQKIFEDHWIVVNKHIALAQIQLKLYQDAEKSFYKIIDQLRADNREDVSLYATYNDLFLHLLRTNLNKAILLGKALLSPSEKQQIPLLHQKLFMFNIGTAYLLKQNYADAKYWLQECLSHEPNNMLKGWTLNNLGLATWWHRYPIIKQFNIDDNPNEFVVQPDYSTEQIKKDFESASYLFRKSLYYIESHSEKRTDLDWLLSEDKIPENPEQEIESITIQNKYSGKVLINMYEYLFNQEPASKDAQQFWFKYAIQYFEKYDAANIDRSNLLLAWLCATNKQYDEAENLYKITLQMLENKEESFNKILALQLYGSMLLQLGRKSDGEDILKKAYELAETTPFWANRLVHTIVPEIEP
ncbi:hypothetical protein pb186bvf_017104 [Paramecium bursaria]